MARNRWLELCQLVQQDDGLPTWKEARHWTTQKLHFWHRYIDITTTAMVGHSRWPAGLVYVDLFAGAGICTLKGTNERVPGSALIAAYSAKPFKRIVACEKDPALAEALRVRLANSPMPTRCHVLRGDCNDLIDDVIAHIPARALTLAFIDPKALDAKFTTIAALSNSRRVDFVVLFADAYDIPRNVEQHYRQNPDSKLDQVLGPDCRWRQELDELTNPTGPNKRRLFRRLYKKQLERWLGCKYSRNKPIKSERGPVYSLVFASKHELGLKFWDTALKKDVGGQKELF
jgi:three-Cys-motif partner protein